MAVNYYAEPEILFEVDRNSFMPAPKVDSAVIKLNVRKSPALKVNDEKRFFSLVKAAFAQRRKTFVNTVSNTTGLSKDKIKEVLENLGISPTVRSEQLTMQELTEISNNLF